MRNDAVNATRYAFAAGRNRREGLRGELVQLVRQRVDGCGASDEQGAGFDTLFRKKQINDVSLCFAFAIRGNGCSARW
jgi:hypothetical protein